MIGIVAVALAGNGLALLVGFRPPSRLRSPTLRISGFTVVLAATSWLTFLLALRAGFPLIKTAVPVGWAAAALAADTVASAVALGCALLMRRSARTAMLSGSLLACGQSCFIFVAMTGLVRPFALSYDLSGVVVVMLVSAACWVVAFRHADQTWRLPFLVVVTGFAGALLPIGSLASILPLEAWMSAIDQPDDLSSAPLVVIGATEGAVVLVLCLFGSLVDNRTDARDRLEASRLRQLADSTFEGILIHRHGEIIDANESLADMLGLHLSEALSSPVERFIVSVNDAASGTAVRTSSVRETEIVTSRGERIPVEMLSRPVIYGGAPAVATALRDIRERKASEARIRFLAHHDMLTGLPNRVSLKDRLEEVLARPDRASTSVALLCLDLDGFKLVNDTLGHAAGDLLLRNVADRIRAALDDSAFVARIGGDEFVVVQSQRKQPFAAVEAAKAIIAALIDPFELEGNVATVGTSIGIALAPQDGTDPTLLLKKADIALYQAKHNGRGWYSLFETGMDQSISARHALETELRAALAADGLALAFQPLFGPDREITSCEALVRWNHPERGPIPPSEFIPIAEQSGLIIPLSRWVLHTACAAAAEWQSSCRIAVNLSPAQFIRGDLLATVMTVLEETGLAAERLELEITEGVLMDNTERTLETLKQLRGLGVSLVLDDFGTGYSSLSYLHRFPLNKLKVDRSFVQRMGADPSARAIISAVVAMSHSLSLAVTAEGVETLDQFEMLRAEGCDTFQGYALSRPLPASQIARYMRDHGKAEPGGHPEVGTRASEQVEAGHA